MPKKVQIILIPAIVSLLIYFGQIFDGQRSPTSTGERVGEPNRASEFLGTNGLEAVIERDRVNLLNKTISNENSNELKLTEQSLQNTNIGVEDVKQEKQEKQVKQVKQVKEIQIGDFVDPEDQSTWPPSKNIVEIRIGVTADPEDPSTWPYNGSAKEISIGKPLDPDSQAALVIELGTDPVIVGEPLNPDEFQARDLGSDTVISIGEYIDPETQY